MNGDACEGAGSLVGRICFAFPKLKLYLARAVIGGTVLVVFYGVRVSYSTPCLMPRSDSPIGSS